MSEENRWDEDLPEVNENVPTEEKPLDTFGNTDTGSAADNSTENIDIAQKPMAHPYSAGRRMQENGYGNGKEGLRCGRGREQAYVYSPGTV